MTSQECSRGTMLVINAGKIPLQSGWQSLCCSHTVGSENSNVTLLDRFARTAASRGFVVQLLISHQKYAAGMHRDQF